MSLPWLPGFLGVDQIETRHPLPHFAIPHRCPELVGSRILEGLFHLLRMAGLLTMLTSCSSMLPFVNTCTTPAPSSPFPHLTDGRW